MLLQPHVEMYMYGKYCSYYVEVQCLTGCLVVLYSRTAGLSTVKKQQLKRALTSVQILFLRIRAATLASALLFLFSTCNFFSSPQGETCRSDISLEQVNTPEVLQLIKSHI